MLPFIIKDWKVKLGRGGRDPGGCAQQAWEGRFLALQEGIQLALWVSSAEAGNLLFWRHREGTQ